MKMTFHGLETWCRLRIEGPAASRSHQTSCVEWTPRLNRHLTRTRRSAVAGCALGLLLSLAVARPAVAVEPVYESYFMFLWCDPHKEELGFLDGNQQLQGLAHDANNWFISAGEDMHCPPHHNPTWGIWKFHVSVPLTGLPAGRILLADLPNDISSHFFHVGDIDCFHGIILAPVESYNCPESNHAAILFFDAQDLHYIGKARLDDYRDFGWVAVNPADSLIYVSTDSTRILTTYALTKGWADLLAQRGQTDLEVELTKTADIPLLTGQGGPFPDVFHNTQGGAFSESGDMFYFLVGAGCGPNQCDLCTDWYLSDEIHAFDTKTWREERVSLLCKEDAPGFCGDCMDFRFYWEPWWLYWDGWNCAGTEPEGIDVWDLDRDGRSPYRGQLHVGWLNNGVGQDDVSIWHYTHSLYADAASPPGGDGRPGDGHGLPFNTLQQAHERACNGAHIKLQPGYYNETLTLTTRVILEPRGPGMVVIGAAGP